MLIVIHGEEELRVELEGWTLEEVTAVVRSIETGDWGYFQVMMALAGEQGLSARGTVHGVSYDTGSALEAIGSVEVGPTVTSAGSENGAFSLDGEELPPLEDIVEDVEELDVPSGSVEWVWWMCRSWFAVVGVCFCLSSGGLLPDLFDDLPLSVRLVCFVWVLSALQRIWVLTVEPDTPWILARWECWSMDLPQGNGLGHWAWKFWVICVILFGLALPVEASDIAEHDGLPWEENGLRAGEIVAVTGSRTLQCQAQSSGVKVMIGGYETWLAFFTHVFCTIAAWETFTRCWCRKRSTERTAALIQTEDEGIVPMPLADGVPNRAAILFSLWRAGYRIDLDPYPEEVREEFFGMTGNQLRQLSEASS